MRKLGKSCVNAPSLYSEGLPQKSCFKPRAGALTYITTGKQFLADFSSEKEREKYPRRERHENMTILNTRWTYSKMPDVLKERPDSHAFPVFSVYSRALLQLESDRY